MTQQDDTYSLTSIYSVTPVRHHTSLKFVIRIALQSATFRPSSPHFVGSIQEGRRVEEETGKNRDFMILKTGPDRQFHKRNKVACLYFFDSESLLTAE